MHEFDGASSTATLTKATNDIWIVDDRPISAAGLRLPVRMTVIRLLNGDLILHSPVRYSVALRDELERLGPIKYLMAPNVAHWMFLQAWQKELPEARTFAARGLSARRQVREAGLRIDRELGASTPQDWAAELETVPVQAPMFSEVEIFDKRSRTLVLTDLVENLDPHHLPPSNQAVASLLGIAKPHGMAPIYLRMLLRLGGRSVQAAAERLVGLAPERVIFAHGDWFETDGTQRLRQSLRWLLPARASRAPARSMADTRVVITGASSGIGRAAALAFAREGGSVVLAARRGEILAQLAAECEALGGRALAVPTDVTDADAVRRLARQAEDAFGGIDVWINNAGTGVFGPYQDADLALHRRTIEVNLLGTMNGAFAVLPIFLRQKRGILVNNISLGGWAPTPFAAAYTASKFGLRGFTASLRQELRAHPHIHVCGVFPAMVDTPGFVHGANMSGKTLDPGPMLYQSEDVAETFLSLVRAPRDEVAVGWPARAGQMAYAIAPKLTEDLLGSAFRFLLSRAKRAPISEGSMIEASPPGTSVDGGWLVRKQLPPAGVISKGLAVLGIAACAAVVVSALARPRRQTRTQRRRA
ncbi:short-subunit dehydrogenase [Bradyrhizobium sp. R2.2-H]|jgi:short-subunit dehydrogenase|uniref:SDR family oxidoreductase n=1 Tax=unclassified Bradyrhizobium TaxID=2631580 RepID=UPI0010457C2D|nr:MULTISPECIES: SDR family oxidoreductase [unclassified Bradyrhizobium]TCU65544.1 short-subunit dehydrogenase [Bradyrhizobium sp. Y-H1]TCU67691.1 short-subunit dehydrogenase [Bradyrhizobium sp. R2.2-H]